MGKAAVLDTNPLKEALRKVTEEAKKKIENCKGPFGDAVQKLQSDYDTLREAYLYMHGRLSEVDNLVGEISGLYGQQKDVGGQIDLSPADANPGDTDKLKTQYDQIGGSIKNLEARITRLKGELEKKSASVADLANKYKAI